MHPTVLAVNNHHHLVGGSERYYLELGKLLESRGHRVVHLSTKDPRNHAPSGPALFLEPVDLAHPGPRDLLRFHYSRRSAGAVRQLLREHAPDVAHLHIYYGHMTASILAPLRRAGVPIVQTLHEYKLICPVYRLVSGDRVCEACDGGRFWRALPRRCNRGSLARTALSVSESYVSRWLGAVRHVDHFLASSDFLRRKVIEHGLPAERVSWLPSFVDAAALEPARSPGRHLLYFGRLERLKGVLTLLEAARELGDLPLLVAGQGEARPEIEARICAGGLDHVRLLQPRDGPELHALIRESLCSVLPSEWYENCPMSVLETMALGRPVVAARIGGIPELVREGETGLLFEPGNAEELAQRLRWLREHPRQALEMGARGRELVLSEFGPERHYERLLEVYRRLA